MLGVRNPGSEIVPLSPLFRRGIATKNEKGQWRHTQSLILMSPAAVSNTISARSHRLFRIARQQIQMTP